MPFIKGGALFLKVAGQYPLETLLRISLTLIDEPAPIEFTGKVVWVTPKHERNQLPEGIGIQFSEEDAKLMRTKIEEFMTDAFSVDRTTTGLF
jgi:Tfp pilus assembly protein PilZ